MEAPVTAPNNTAPDNNATNDDVADLVNGTENDALKDLLCRELLRLAPDQRTILLGRLREHSEYRLSEGRRALDPAPPLADAQPLAQKPQSLAALGLRGLAGLCLLVAGFVLFWYGMIFGVPHHSEGQMSTTWVVVRFAWCALLTWMLARDLRGGKLAAAWAMARRVTLPMIGLNILVIAVTIATAFALLALFPALERSWLYLLPGTGGHAGNLGLIPTQIKYFGIAFLLLFAVSIPDLARSEELRYRRGTKGWRQGLWRSLRFGLVHCVVGVPLYAGLALTVGGLWFTLQYFRGGVEGSTLHHATYNWILVSAALVVTTLWSFR